MSHAERVKFDAAMTQLDAAVLRAQLQPSWESAKRARQVEKAEREITRERMAEGRY